MESVAEDAGYEVVDADKARERRAKKMEKKTEAVPAPVASVYTEEEVCVCVCVRALIVQCLSKEYHVT